MSGKSLLLGLVVLLAAGPAVAAPIGIFDDHHDIGNPAGGDPGVPGSATLAGGVYTVTASGSDWWGNGEYGYILYKNITGNVRIETDVAWVDPTTGNNWKKAGVMFRNDADVGPPNHREVNYFGVITDTDNGSKASFQWRDAPNTNMGGNNIGGLPNLPVKVAIQRYADPVDTAGFYLVSAFMDLGLGAGWEPMGTPRFAMNMNENAIAGLGVTSHEQNVARTVNFTNPAFVPVVVPTTFPRVPGSPVNAPDLPPIIDQNWSVVEVADNGNMSHALGDFIGSLESGTGTRVAYNTPDPMNYNDHEGNKWNFPNDRGYQLVYDGLKSAGGINDAAFLAKGIVNIPSAGDWSFYCAGDDTTELTVRQGGNTKLVIGDETWNSNSFGTANLAAGPAEIQFIFGEDGGGMFHEVAAAKGATNDINQFNLIGSGDPGTPGIPAHDSIIPAIINVNVIQTDPTQYGLGLGGREPSDTNDDIDNLNEAQWALANLPLFANTATSVNHSDVDTAGGGFGFYTPDLPNPYDDPTSTPAGAPGTADDDYGFQATAQLVINTPGTYYLGYNSDDGAQLQVVGVPWNAIVVDGTGSAVLAGDTMITDVYTGSSNTVGEIDLAGGTYDLVLTMFERGGGAGVELFGGSALDGLDLLTDLEHLVHVDATEGVAPALELIPEPATLALLGLGLLGLIRRKR